MDYHIMAFTWLNKILGRGNHATAREVLRPLWAAVVAEARRKDWYLAGQVPDTIDGRFDVLSLMAAHVLLRLEDFGAEGLLAMARFAELFAEDMDGQLRQEGHGDVGVGNRVEELVGALGGRLGALRAVGKGEETMEAMLTRNLYRGAEVDPLAMKSAIVLVAGLSARLQTTDLAALRGGKLSHGE
jgi:cytochrome b pre-mRNA-processing protein 3